MKYLATLGFIGFTPIAPGTFGSLCAFVLFFIIKPTPELHIITLLVTIPIGVLSCYHAEKALKEKDSRHIVIDEFCGYLIAVLFLPITAGYAAAAFFLFRLFDILKPFPIRKIESSLKGGTGIMADDAVAAVYTNVILQFYTMVA